MKLLTKSLLIAAVSSLAVSAQAGKLSVWNTGGWQQFDQPSGLNVYEALNSNPANAYDLNTQTNDNNYIRSYQDQRFDAEYLFYKYDADTKQLSLGLQTGFNMATGVDDSYYRGRHTKIYGGDMRLNIGGKTFAVDFGLESRTTFDKQYRRVLRNSQLLSGSNDAGVYETTSTQWSKKTDNDDGTVKWARTGGNKVADFDSESQGSNTFTYEAYSELVDSRGRRRIFHEDNTSYYRTVSFNLENVLGQGFDENGFNIDAFWTMSCYNDSIQGSFHIPKKPPVTVVVPEPASLALLGLGLLGLGISRKRKA